MSHSRARHLLALRLVLLTVDDLEARPCARLRLVLGQAKQLQHVLHVKRVLILPVVGFQLRAHKRVPLGDARGLLRVRLSHEVLEARHRRAHVALRCLPLDTVNKLLILKKRLCDALCRLVNDKRVSLEAGAA